MSDSEYQVYPGQEPDGGEIGSDVGPTSAGGSGSFSLLFICLMAVAALVGLVFVASHWKKEVLVRDFIVDGSSLMVKRDLLLHVIGFKGRNLQDLDVEELKTNLMVFPYIRDAAISKELNGVVRIRVFEREPVALAIIAGRKTVLDREGFLLPWNQTVAERFPKLLDITGISRLKTAGNGLQQLDQRDITLILQFLESLSQTDYASMLIRELHLAGNNMSWCLVVQAPTHFIVGNDGNFKEKLKKFEIFWQKVISKKGFDCYDTVDLRFRDRVFTTDIVSSQAP